MLVVELGTGKGLTAAATPVVPSLAAAFSPSSAVDVVVVAVEAAAALVSVNLELFNVIQKMYLCSSSSLRSPLLFSFTFLCGVLGGGGCSGVLRIVSTHSTRHAE